MRQGALTSLLLSHLPPSPLRLVLHLCSTPLLSFQLHLFGEEAAADVNQSQGLSGVTPLEGASPSAWTVSQQRLSLRLSQPPHPTPPEDHHSRVHFH